MVDHEDLDARLRRLRQSTEGLSPPAGFVQRTVASASARAAPLSWGEAIVRVARWALVPAAVASAILAVAAWPDQSAIEEAVYLGTAAGLLP